MRIFCGFALLSMCIACSSFSKKVQQNYGVHSALPTAPIRIVEINNFALTEPAALGERALKISPKLGDTAKGTDTWQWHGRNAVGAPQQSFVTPTFLGGDDVLLSTLGGGIGVYSIKSGSAKWQVKVPVGVAAQPLVEASFVFVAGMDGYVRKLRLDTGHEEWKARLSAESLGGIAAHQSFIFVTAGDDTLWALDEKTGQAKWTYKRPSPQNNVYWSLKGNSVPILSPDGSRVFAGFSDGVFVALESSSGQTVWERNFDRAGRFKDADQLFTLNQDGSQIFIPLVDGDLVVLRSSDGASIWTVAGGGGGVPLLVESEAAIYALGNDGHLVKVETKTGKLLWSTKLTETFATKPVIIDDDFLALTSSDFGILFVNRKTGEKIQQYYLGNSQLAALNFDGRRLLYLSGRNRLHTFKVERRQ